ncbi:MAG: sodium:solute symporter family protein [Candidatus Competibacter sp.]
MIWLVLYIVLLFGIGVHHWLRHRGASLDGFVVYDRQAGGFSVGMSLVALAFGASSVFGLAGYAYQYNLNAIWWTLSGAIFLVVLAYTFLDTVWRVRGYTIGDIIARVFGDNIRLLVSAVLFLAWLMVLAGQIIAGGNILTQFLGDQSWGYGLFTLIFTAYSLLVGQAGTVKTGFLQVVVMVAGLVLLLGLCLTAGPPEHGARPPVALHFGFDEAFSFTLFLGVFVPVGLSYWFGPDMYSRIFLARDIASARRGLLLASASIVAISLIIVSIGILAKGIVTVAKPDLTVQTLVNQFFSGPLADFVLVALLSIPLSGADIILITTGTLLGRDVIAHGLRALGRAPDDAAQVWIIRGCMILAAALATGFALRLQAIIPSLLIAYKVFSISIVPLLFLSLLSIRRGAAAVATGPANRLVAVYLVLASLAVLLVELKFIPLTLPNYSLYLLLGNTAILLLLLRLGGHRFRPAAPALTREGNPSPSRRQAV